MHLVAKSAQQVVAAAAAKGKPILLLVFGMRSKKTQDHSCTPQTPSKLCNESSCFTEAGGRSPAQITEILAGACNLSIWTTSEAEYSAVLGGWQSDPSSPDHSMLSPGPRRRPKEMQPEAPTHTKASTPRRSSPVGAASSAGRACVTKPCSSPGNLMKTLPLRGQKYVPCFCSRSTPRSSTPSMQQA